MIGQKKKSVQEYRQLEILSSSDLRTFSLDRRKFYREVISKETAREEEYSKSLLVGDIAHTLLLEPQNFDEKYFLSICPEPPTGLMLQFTEALYRHTVANMDENGEIRGEFGDIARAAHSDSGFKLTLETVMNKFKDSNAELYYKELREAKTHNKTVVCVEDLSMAEKCVNTVKTHPFTADIFNQEEDENHLVFNELQNESFKIDDLGLKMMGDKIIVNKKNKIISIYDPKFVWDNWNFYREYYLKRRAYIQGYVYYQGLKSANLGIDIDDYTINYPTFVAVDTSNFYAPIKYTLSEQDMDDAYNGFEVGGRRYEGVREIIENIKWCQATGQWNTSREIFDNDGFSILK